MSSLDQFESAFRSASKARLHYARPELRTILVITDLERDAASTFTEQVQRFLGPALRDDEPAWQTLLGADYANIGELLALVRQAAPDLICTYRHLHSSDWSYQHSLGEYLDVLSQAREVPPVLVLPHPEAQREASHALHNTDAVMAITDHLTGSDHLVNMAARLTQSGGTLWLSHVEDEVSFTRIITAISKIPTIETERARVEIRAQLLKEPRDFVASCREVLDAAEVSLKLEELVVMGQSLATYRQLIDDHKIDLLVMNTKDEDQLAMHGMAYPLAVEVRSIPLLLL
jgi:hypothetical protein